MTGLQKIRTIFIVLIAVFGAAAVILAGYLFLRGATNLSQIRAEEKQLQQQLDAKTVENALLSPHSMDKKLTETREDIKKFYAQHVPGYYSQISGELHKLETENGVTEQGIRYKAEDAGVPNVQRVEIDTGIASDYLKIAHFISALERDQWLFVIEQISVTGQPAGTVQLQLKLETFLKGAA